MASLFGRPSRSYKNVGHDADGLSPIGTTPYSMRRDSDNHSIKTYRPSYTDLHFRRQAMNDPNASSTFSPLPQLNSGRRSKKERAAVGHRNEVNHILDPGYRGALDDDATSIAGPSRLQAVRTAGGLAALTGRKKDRDDLRHSGSVASFHPRDPKGGAPGVYVDSSGRLHDTEYDPFAGVTEMSRRKSKRRSAFGGPQRRGSSSSGSSDASSDHGGRRAFDERDECEEPEREYRRRLEAERRQLDEVSGYAAARRKSMMSDRGSGYYSGRATPSIRSGRDLDDAVSLANGRPSSRLPVSPTFDSNKSAVSGSSSKGPRSNIANSADAEESPRKHTEHDMANGKPNKASQPAVKVAAPTPPEGVPEEPQPPHAPPAEEVPEGEDEHDDYASFDENEEAPPEYDEGDETPRLSAKTPIPDLIPIPTPRAVPNGDAKHTINVLPKGVKVKDKRLPSLPDEPKSRVERAPSGGVRVTGFDAGPARPMPASQSVRSSRLGAGGSVMSVASSRSSEPPSERDRDRERDRARPRPKERPREQLFPETPAQAKRREERERRNLRAGRTRAGQLAADTLYPVQSGTSSRSRILPEIEIVADDDPRIVFPPNGPSTRIQTKFDHVIRSPPGTNAGSIYSPAASTRPRGISEGPGEGDVVSLPSSRSVRHDGSSKEPSTIIEESGGGYLPSRWASGDRQLRVTEEEKDRYRPREWGGRRGDLGGRAPDWQPTVKDDVKRNVKDMSTNARFSMFRAKKKLLRKV